MTERASIDSDKFEGIWSRTLLAAGEEFLTITGKPFTYAIVRGAVVLENTARVLARSQFERAAVRASISGPGQLQDLQGPSYVFAILTDRRVAPSLRREVS